MCLAPRTAKQSRGGRWQNKANGKSAAISVMLSDEGGSTSRHVRHSQGRSALSLAS